MARLGHLILVASFTPVLSGGCVRGNQRAIAYEPPSAPTCELDGGLPDTSLSWESGPPAAVTAPQDAGWITVSTAPECAGLAPGPVPPRLSWESPPSAYCDPDVVDGHGDLAEPEGLGTSSNTRFFRNDGSSVTSPMWFMPATFLRGFWLGVGSNTCSLVGRASPYEERVETLRPVAAGAYSANPQGGYVQTAITTQLQPRLQAAWVRWLDDDLQPTSDWQFVTTWTIEPTFNAFIAPYVDVRGRALVLAFLQPLRFGPPPPSSSWKSIARWMGPDGPLADAFEPMTPAYTNNGVAIDWAGWGTMLRLPEGGFAAFHDAASPYPGTTSPSGWYAWYPSGEPRAGAAPAWLQAYDGSIQLLGGARAYAAVRRDSGTCARTALIIASTGRTCFALPLEGSDLCGREGLIYHRGFRMWPDGTLVMQDQNQCQSRWWPGLAWPRLARP